jgi:hypothetical protein
MKEETQIQLTRILDAYNLPQYDRKIDEMQRCVERTTEIALPQTVNFSVDSIVQTGTIPIMISEIGSLSYYVETSIRIHKKYKDCFDLLISTVKIYEELKSVADAKAVLYLAYADQPFYAKYEDIQIAVLTLNKRYETLNKQYDMLSRLIKAHEQTTHGINPDRMPQL